MERQIGSIRRCASEWGVCVILVVDNFFSFCLSAVVDAGVLLRVCSFAYALVHLDHHFFILFVIAICLGE